MAATDLSRRLASYFSAKTLEKGNAYYASKRVVGLGGGATNASAKVKGDSGTYSVFFNVDELTPSQLWCTCDCPYASQNGLLCKHIWAVLLAADNRYLLRGKNGTPPRWLALEDEESDEDEDNNEDDDYEDVEDETDDTNEVQIKRLFAETKPGKLKGLNKVLSTRIRTAKLPSPAKRVPDWRDALLSLSTCPSDGSHLRYGWGANREVVYVVVRDDQKAKGLNLHVMIRERKTDGTWGKPKNGKPSRSDLPQMPPIDREIISVIFGAESPWGNSYGYPSNVPNVLNTQLIQLLLPKISATGRLFIKDSASADYLDASLDDGPAWRFEVDAEKAADGKNWKITGVLARGEERVALSLFAYFWSFGLCLRGQTFAFVDNRNAFGWLMLFRRKNELIVPASQFDEFLADSFTKLEALPIQLPADAGIAVKNEAMKPTLAIKKSDFKNHNEFLQAELIFQYGNVRVKSTDKRSTAFDHTARAIIQRDLTAEANATERIVVLGLLPPNNVYSRDHHSFTLRNKQLPEVVRTLVAEGWQVEAEGKLYRTATHFELSVTSGIDWFELHGKADFGDQYVDLPQILEAIRNRQTMVELGDGEIGMLPEEWLKKYALLAGTGEKKKDHIRFEQNQVGLLDALLAAQSEVDLDEKFREARDRFRSFKGIKASKPPKSFVGELRQYQSEGLGWLKFLRDFRFGGCLADDMGLGKTVQVLALLADRAETRPAGVPRPSLIVVPKSLVFNWKAETAKFAPQLKLLDYTGIDRNKDKSQFAKHDLVLTTYGTLRNDAPILKDIPFDYGILDESQAIKNASSESAKACRLLNVRNPLAMSGKPIENHLGELWSLFEYLNPGMLGRATAFQLISGTAAGASEENRTILSQAIRPFILRRTKDQVAKDLPKKTEQTVFCELEPGQRRVYNDLKEYYRKSILGAVERDGMGKAKIQILEALLRLRQAACHPALLDKKNKELSSTKLDALMPQLQEVFEEGHKALVFSQFTSFLTLVKERLDAEGIPYEYLDGKTRNRQEKVDQFQNDPKCKLFLISLKAGGVGLNLTAAEYVFLLDPWWNPAVEAQAIDRAHRIGQTKSVFAYRFIAKDTVEEKVLALQKSKKALADSIINEDNSLIRSLKKEDLEMLLS